MSVLVLMKLNYIFIVLIHLSIKLTAEGRGEMTCESSWLPHSYLLCRMPCESSYSYLLCNMPCESSYSYLLCNMPCESSYSYLLCNMPCESSYSYLLCNMPCESYYSYMLCRMPCESSYSYLLCKMLCESTYSYLLCRMPCESSYSYLLCTMPCENSYSFLLCRMPCESSYSYLLCKMPCESSYSYLLHRMPCESSYLLCRMSLSDSHAHPADPPPSLNEGLHHFWTLGLPPYLLYLLLYPTMLWNNITCTARKFEGKCHLRTHTQLCVTICILYVSAWLYRVAGSHGDVVTTV